MGFLDRIFRIAKSETSNPAIKKLYYHFRTLTPTQATAVNRVPKLANTLREGTDYIYQRVICEMLQEYDERFHSQILPQMDDDRKQKVKSSLLHYMLVQVYSDLSSHVGDQNMAGLMVDAVHYEIFGALPLEKGSFVEYLQYENPNFEDPTGAPVYKFGHDMAAVTGFVDMYLPMMFSQQSPLILELTKKLTALALVDEPGQGASVSTEKKP